MTVSAPSPTESEVLGALGAFLQAVLPAGTDVVTAQVNRVPEPASKDFAVMTPLSDRRLATNVDEWLDVRFTGSIAALALTVSSVDFGVIAPPCSLFGVGVASPTTILSQTSGTPGGAGVYAVDASQTLSSRTLASGAESVTQELEHKVQIDFHSDDLSKGAGMARAASTLLRDAFACDFFSALPAPQNQVSPLHADDPRQAPFLNEAQQVEWRWIVEAMLQANVVVSVSQQFADAAAVEVISVDATFPP